MNKSVFGVLGILVAGFLVIFVTLSYTKNLSNSTDLRSRASNPADSVTDSDALLDASENALESTEKEDAAQEAEAGSDDAELKELNAL